MADITGGWEHFGYGAMSVAQNTPAGEGSVVMGIVALTFFALVVLVVKFVIADDILKGGEK